jgi:predicted RNA-binding protein with EMAP domain
MRHSKHTRSIITAATKRVILLSEEEDSYLEHRVYRRNAVSSIKTKETMKEIVETIESLIRQLKKCVMRSEQIVDEEKLETMNDFAESLAKLIDQIVVIQEKFSEEMND